MLVQPINNFVIVKLDPSDTRVGSLYTAAELDNTYEIPKRTGTVMAVGRGLITAGGCLITPQVKAGDRVILIENVNKMSRERIVNVIDFNGEKCAVLPDESPIIGIITKEDSVLV